MKKKILNCILVMSLMAIMFVGCGNEDAVKEEEVSSENSSVAEESINSEEVGEENSETVSEEISEEPVEVDYSADTVMALCDELAEKYVYDDPEYIKSLVIAANLDYITEEDLNTILTTWGYTMEDLAVIYEEGIISATEAYLTTYEHISGAANVEFNDEVNYSNRILLQNIMLNPDDKEFAAKFDEVAIEHDGETVGSYIIEKPLTSCDALLCSIAYTYRRGVVANVYAEYISEDVN